MTANGSAPTTITLTGTGRPPPRAVGVSPVAVEFGDVRINMGSTSAPVSIRNLGGETLTVSSVATTSGFSIAGPTTGYELTPNTTQEHLVTCQPPGIGAVTGNLLVISNDPNRPSITIPLSCRGIQSNLDITPSPAALPTTRVGEPVDATIDLRNTGSASMTISQVALQGNRLAITAAPAPGTVLAASTGQTRVGLRFDASVKGDSHGTLQVTYDGGEVRSTEISARALATSMALTPDGEIDFGPICSGRSKTREFTLLANEAGAFSLDMIPDPGPPFTVMRPALPVLVEGGGVMPVSFKVTAAPTQEGKVMAPLTVHSDIPGANEHTLSLHVEGLPAGVTGTPAVIDFGERPVNATTIGQEVHLLNCGEAPMALMNARLEGGDASDFAIVAEPAVSTLPPQEVASWLIVMQPRTLGPKQATFLVDYDGKTASTGLGGTGVGDPPPLDGPPTADPPPLDDAPAISDRGSYYACGAGQPTALWPMVVALVPLLRRRRGFPGTR